MSRRFEEKKGEKYVSYGKKELRLRLFYRFPHHVNMRRVEDFVSYFSGMEFSIDVLYFQSQFFLEGDGDFSFLIIKNFFLYEIYN